MAENDENSIEINPRDLPGILKNFEDRMQSDPQFRACVRRDLPKADEKTGSADLTDSLKVMLECGIKHDKDRGRSGLS